MVYSFEPCNKTREVLFQNIKLNHLLFDVDFRPNVISDFEGVGRFFELTDDSQKALSMLEGNPASHKKGEWTSKKVTTIDLFTFDNKIKPTAIKIDTEGNELAVLKGAIGTIKKHHPIIQCEYSQENANQYGYNVNRIAEFLMMFGYEIEIKDGDLFAI
jgi:FkbM family methyltransferase